MKINNVISLLANSKELIHNSVLIFRQSQLTTDLRNIPDTELMELKRNLIIVKADIEKILAAMQKPKEIK